MGYVKSKLEHKKSGQKSFGGASCLNFKLQAQALPLGGCLGTGTNVLCTAWNFQQETEGAVIWDTLWTILWTSWAWVQVIQTATISQGHLQVFLNLPQMWIKQQKCPETQSEIKTAVSLRGGHAWPWTGSVVMLRDADCSNCSSALASKRRASVRFRCGS